MSRIPTVCPRCHGAKNVLLQKRRGGTILKECPKCDGKGVIYEERPHKKSKK